MSVEPRFWQHICEHLNDPLFIVTPGGRIKAVNRAAEKAARKKAKDMIGQSICQIIHGGRLPHIKCPLEEFLATRKGRIMETRLPGLFGDYLLSVIPVCDDDCRSVEELCLIARELTSEEARQLEYHHTAHLAAIGELAAGVAHEINNPINGIINFAQILLEDSRSGPEQDLLQRIVNEGERIASITHKLLFFARGGEEQKDALDCREVIRDTLALIRHQLNLDSIEVVIDSQDDLPNIIGNRHQLQQVFFNIISNARYALNQRYEDSKDPGKKIIVFCREEQIESGQYVCIAITDHGTGIPQGILDRICDPFFSTKPPGAGTGLGLSISHGIIRNHNGMIRIDSVLHQYTTVSIYLPTINVLPPVLGDEPLARS